MHLTLMGLEPLTELENIWDMTLSERLQGVSLGDDLDQPLFQLFKYHSQVAVICKICHRNRWSREGLVYICDDHPPIKGLPIRVLDSVRAETVYAVPITETV
jgi:hypothetical protein